MKNITYYNAGAGSGKTYTLTHILAKLIKDGLNPSQVILTTFTEAAAADFREKARAVLYEEKLYDKAVLLDQAEIGTVHSISYNFIKRYWYLLGLSPQVDVLDEESTNFYINQSLASLPSEKDLNAFRNFQWQFNITYDDGTSYSRPHDDFWKGLLNDIISKKTSFRVNDLDKSRDMSLEKLKTFFQPIEGQRLNREAILPVLREVKDIAQTETSARGQVRFDSANTLLNTRRWRVKDFADAGKLLNGLPGKYQGIEGFENAKVQLADVWRSEDVFNLIKDVVERLFALAKKWTDEYEQYKQDMHIIDFDDMEKYMLRLLSNEDTKELVEKEIKGRYKVLMVDEFQDSSPIQVDIFDRLSELVEESYWCGDAKQAIYGFRGTDTQLTEAVVGMIPKEKVKTLETSYRSQPELVNFCNSIFCKIFQNYNPELETEKIVLKPHREKEEGINNLIHWASDSSNQGDFIDSVALKMRKFVNDNNIDYKDIAVLARTNGELAIMADALNKYGVPVNLGSGTLAGQKETELLKAVLTLIIDENNLLAKAKIAYLAEPGNPLTKLIDSRLEDLAALSDNEEAEKSQWLNSSPLVQQVMSRKEQWTDQSVKAQVESVITELNLRGIVKRWGNWKNREANLEQIISIADQYCQYCDTMKLGATTNGFLDYLDDHDADAAGNPDGVVLTTYHRAKGLEWKNVVLLSMDNNVANEKRVISGSIFGVHFVRTEAPTKDNLFPDMQISLMPWIFGKSKVPEYINDAVIGSEDYRNAIRTELGEAARLLYVGMTRARDRLIITSKKDSGSLKWLANLGIRATEIPAGGSIDLFGTGIGSSVEQIAPGTDKDIETQDAVLETHESDLTPVVPGEYAPKYISPSLSGKTEAGKIGEPLRISSRIPVKGSPEMDLVGTCIHNIYAAWTADDAANAAVAQRLVKAFGFEAVLPDTNAILAARKALADKLTKDYGPCVKEYHELPFQHLCDGQIVRGSMDLVWETAEGCVLIDFKTFPGSVESITNPESDHYAGLYKPQFDFYRAALTAAGKNVLASHVFYPVGGMLVSI